MNNQVFINQMKNYYESLQYFSIENNYLILNIEDNSYKIPFTNVDLTMLSPNLFYIEPKELFHILYMLELLTKTTLTDYEIDFVKKYVNRYLTLNDLALEKDGMNTELVWGIGIPIYNSYDPDKASNPAAMVISEILNSHTETLESGRGNHQVLSLKPNGPFAMLDEDPTPADFTKAGFTTLALIFTAAISTIMYIVNFMLGN